MTDTNSLAGSYAVITGSTQGLGRATAELFAERGAAGIIVTGRNAERGETVARGLTNGGCRAVFVQADVGDVDGCRRVIAAADEAFGTLHVRANIAALTERGSIWDTKPEFFDQIAVNVRAPFFLMQDAVKLMAREGAAGPSSTSQASPRKAASRSCVPTRRPRGPSTCSRRTSPTRWSGTEFGSTRSISAGWTRTART